jgi:polygalacturonase
MKSHFCIGKIALMCTALHLPLNGAELDGFVTNYYEAENSTARSGGDKQTTYYPYIGSGYFAFGGNGSYCEWNDIPVAQEGSYTLLIKYANGTAANKPCELHVNGSSVRNVLFAPTDNWNTWWNARVVVKLNRGKNTIRLTANTEQGGPNIDNLAISNRGLEIPPAPIFNVRKYGATGNGTTNDTAAIQAAINDCQNSHGSVVLDGHGIFLAGTLHLKSNMTFWIAEGSTLKGSQADADYPPLHPRTTSNFVWNPDVRSTGSIGRALLHAEGQTNLTITGGGKIDGNDDKPSWIGDKAIDKKSRPSPVFIATTKKLTITNIDIVNGAMFTCVPLECEDVVIDGVNTRSVNITNRDGINVVDCHRVLITNCTIASEDDALCQKSGCSKGIAEYRAANITINRTSCGGIKYGTQSYGPFSNSSFTDIAMRGLNGGRHAVFCGIELESVDGGAVSNIRFERIKMSNMGSLAFILNGAGLWGRHPADQPSQKGRGEIRNILIKDVECKDVTTSIGSPIMGTIWKGNYHRVSDITFENVSVDFRGGHKGVPPDPVEYTGKYPEFSNWGNLPAAGYFIRHATNIHFINCSTRVVDGDSRPATVIR